MLRQPIPPELVCEIDAATAQRRRARLLARSVGVILVVLYLAGVAADALALSRGLPDAERGERITHLVRGVGMAIMIIALLTLPRNPVMSRATIRFFWCGMLAFVGGCVMAVWSWTL